MSRCLVSGAHRTLRKLIDFFCWTWEEHLVFRNEAQPVRRVAFTTFILEAYLYQCQIFQRRALKVINKFELVSGEVTRRFRFVLKNEGDTTSKLTGQAIAEDESYMNRLGAAEKAQETYTKQKGYVQLH
jgi:hypothetical protein